MEAIRPASGYSLMMMIDDDDEVMLGYLSTYMVCSG